MQNTAAFMETACAECNWRAPFSLGTLHKKHSQRPAIPPLCSVFAKQISLAIRCLAVRIIRTEVMMKTSLDLKYRHYKSHRE